MAELWIKMRRSLGDDPKVIRISRMLKLHVDEVVGKLHRLWAWADEHINPEESCNAPGVTGDWIDRYVDMPGFAESLAKVRWIRFTETADGPSTEFVNFEEHNGQTAKQRAVTAKRIERHRKKKAVPACNAGSVTRGEEIREEEIQEPPASHPSRSRQQKQTTPPAATAPADSLLAFPCAGTGPKEWHLTQAKLAEWQEAFPAVDVLSECRKALQWIKDNPRKAKTHTGMTKFLGSWMSRTQDSGRGTAAASQTTPRSTGRDQRSQADITAEWLAEQEGTPQPDGVIDAEFSRRDQRGRELPGLDELKREATH